MKSFCLRYKMKPFTFFTWSGSLYYYVVSEDNYLDAFVLLYGLDLIFKYRFFEFKGGIIGGNVRNPLYTLDEFFIFLSTYLKYGYNLHVKFQVNRYHELRVRFGQINPDTTKVNLNNQFNINASHIWTIPPFQVITTYYFNWPLNYDLIDEAANNKRDDYANNFHHLKSLFYYIYKI